MTDTRITVDVSTEALLQRARQQQAQSRQAAIQREEERKEVERQKREARKAGRNQPPGQDRLKGRSKLRGMAPRHDVAAGYVEKYSLATGFMQEIAYESLGPSGITDRSYPGRIIVKIWSYDQQSTAIFEPGFGQEYYEDVSQFQITITQTYQPLPVGPDSFILWCQKRLSGPTTPLVVTDNQCFLVTQRNVRKIGTPAGADQLIAEGGFAGIAWNYRPYPKGAPQSIQKLLGIEQSTPPFYLMLDQQVVRNNNNQIVDFARNMTGAIHRQANYADTGRPAAWLKKKARTDNEEIVTAKTNDFSATFDPAVNPLYASFPLVAWDWGKPQLCRRLLLQLGFKPEDLRP